MAFARCTLRISAHSTVSTCHGRHGDEATDAAYPMRLRSQAAKQAPEYETEEACMNDLSIEQMCRDLLTVAIRDGLVSSSTDYADPDPQVRSSGELCGMANKLTDMLRYTSSA